jgi:hypothetical protein
MKITLWSWEDCVMFAFMEDLQYILSSCILVFWLHFQNIYKIPLNCSMGMDTTVYIISYQFATCLEILPMNIIFYGVTVNIYSLCCISHTTKHCCQTHVWYSLNKTCLIFLSETPFRFLTWLRIMECGKLHLYFSDVQRLVTVVSYLHLSPGKGFYRRKRMYYRFKIAIQKILLHITKQKTTRREEKRNGKWYAVQQIFT